MATPYDTAVTADSPVSYWKLEESTGTTAADSAGSNPATYAGSPTLGQVPPGRSMGGAVKFNGSSQYAEAADASNLKPTSALTVECWVRLTSNVRTSTFTTIVGKGYQNSEPFMSYQVGGEDVSGKFNTQLTVTATRRTLLSTTVPVVGQWYHLCLTYDGATGAYALYVNGAQEATATFVGSVGYSGTAPFAIGRTNRGAFTGDYWRGSISSVALYNTALSAARVLAHYQAAGLPPVAEIGAYVERPRRPAIQSNWKRGLLVAMPFANEGGGPTTGPLDAVTGKRRAFVGSPTWGKGPWGTDLVVNDSFPGGAGLGSPLLGATQFTLAALCTATAVTGGGVGVRYLWCDQTPTFNMEIGFSNGVLFFKMANSVPNSVECVPPPLNVPVLVTCRMTAANVMSSWYGPYKQVEGSVGATYPGSTTTQLALGTAATSTTRCWSGSISAAYAWNRALSDAEIVTLAGDPFAPVRPVKVSMPVLALSAGALGNRRRRVLLCARGG